MIFVIFFFEEGFILQGALVAQWVNRWLADPEVLSMIPGGFVLTAHRVPLHRAFQFYPDMTETQWKRAYNSKPPILHKVAKVRHENVFFTVAILFFLWKIILSHERKYVTCISQLPSHKTS